MKISVYARLCFLVMGLIALVGFLLPYLFSADDTLLVIAGVGVALIALPLLWWQAESIYRRLIPKPPKPFNDKEPMT